MSLSSELISQFVKVTKDDTKVKKETTVYGTIVYDGKPYVKLDGSDLLTPISTTTNVKDGERVTVMIKDHTATVTGNISSPSARTEEVETLGAQVYEVGTVVAHKVTTDDIQATNAIINNLIAVTGKYSELDAITAEIETLRADFIEGGILKVEDIEAITAKIESIEAEFGAFTDISTEDLEAVNAEITNLKGYTADFTYISAVQADVKNLNADYADFKKVVADEAVVESMKANNIDVLSLLADEAVIAQLIASKATVVKLISDEVDVNYAKIDFANVVFADIEQAWFDEFYAESGIIENVMIGDGVSVKELVGVTISGDLIKANTLVADKLVVRGSDGEYYKLSTNFEGMPGVTPVEEDVIHGSLLAAKSITAEKVYVHDLSAFGASIGGFKITDDSISSLGKPTIDSSGPGIYMDTRGQFHVGDGSNYFKYYLDVEASAEIDDDTLIMRAEKDDVFLASIINNVLRAGPKLGYDSNTIVKLDVEALTIYCDAYKLAISADNILFGAGVKSSGSDIAKLTEHIKMGEIFDEEAGDLKPYLELAEGDSDFKQRITNVKTMFMDGDMVKTEIDSDGIKTDNIRIDPELRHGEFVWAMRENKNYGLSWKGVTS